MSAALADPLSDEDDDFAPFPQAPWAGGPPATAEGPLPPLEPAAAPAHLSVTHQAAAPLATDLSQTGRTTANGLSLDQILTDRPDVYRAFFTEYYEHNDRKSEAWAQRVGGETPQDYANFWYEKYGRMEGYTQEGHAASEAIDCERLLRDRPDVFQAYFTEYYGPHNDRHSDAWEQRVGGQTVQDYARYWYGAYGRYEGYTQAPPPPPPPAAPPGDPEPEPDDSAPAPAPPSEPSVPDPDYRLEDPSLDPWNHPALYPDAHAPDPTSVGQAPPPPDPFG